MNEYIATIDSGHTRWEFEVVAESLTQAIECAKLTAREDLLSGSSIYVRNVLPNTESRIHD
jgi:hypothetical protein